MFKVCERVRILNYNALIIPNRYRTLTVSKATWNTSPRLMTRFINFKQVFEHYIHEKWGHENRVTVIFFNGDSSS